MKILPPSLVTTRSHEYLDDFMHMSVVRMLSVANTLALPSAAAFLKEGRGGGGGGGEEGVVRGIGRLHGCARSRRGQGAPPACKSMLARASPARSLCANPSNSSTHFL